MMNTFDAVNKAQRLLIGAAVGGHVDPEEVTVDLLDTLTTAALNWAMAEEAMKPTQKDDIKSGDLRWVRPKCLQRWEPAEFRKESYCGMMCFMFDQVEYVDDKFMKEWVVGAKITTPPDAVVR
jgi:hypothetical protein